MAEDETRIVSVIGGARRTNRWRVADETTVLTLFGRCLLDLRRAETSADELWFGVTSVFASVEIIVPDGTMVQPSGIALLAGSSCTVPDTEGPGHLPEIEIVANTVLGRLDIHTGDPRPRRGLIRRLLRRPVATAAPAVAVTPASEPPPERPVVTPTFETPTSTAASAPELGEDLAEIDSMIEGVLGDGSTVLGEASDADHDPEQDEDAAA